MKRAWIVATLLCVLAGPAVARVPVLATPDLSQYTAYPVKRIIDGDTIVVIIEGKPDKVRLVGVDSPEKGEPYAKQATQWMDNLLRGEHVYLVKDPKQKDPDRWGRVLAHVYRAPDGMFVSAELIRQGYAKAYTKLPSQYLVQFRALEKFAKQAGKGTWRDGNGTEREKADKKQAAQAELVYRGRPRSKAWVKRMYSLFHDKIALTDGQYVDIGMAVIKQRDIGFKINIGEYYLARGSEKILQVLNATSAIVERPEYGSAREDGSLGPLYNELVFRICGADMSNVVDGYWLDFEGLLYDGPWTYRTARGAKATIPSFTLYRPLTPSQFREALKQGFQLNRYAKTGKKGTIRKILVR